MPEERAHKRHIRAYRFFYLLIVPWVRRKFNFVCDDLREVPEPYLLVSNHNTDFDPIFIANSLHRKKSFIYFVATEAITRMGFLGWWVRRYFDPIVHYKGKLGINTVKEMLAKLKRGHNVAVFPEGNRSFNGQTNEFVSTIGKLAKKSGATLVTYRINGGYFASPRWGKGVRKGKVYGQVVNVYSPEQLASMQEDAVNAVIHDDIYEDAYLRQVTEQQTYIGKDRALGLESALFRCPSCGKIGTLHSVGDRFYCDCGFSAEYDDYGYLRFDDGTVHTITELDLDNRRYISEISSGEGEELLFEDDVTLKEIDTHHNVIRTVETHLEAYRDRLQLGSESLYFRDIDGLAINQRNLLILHIGDKHYDISGPISFSALKYKYLYEKI